MDLTTTVVVLVTAVIAITPIIIISITSPTTSSPASNKIPTTYYKVGEDTIATLSVVGHNVTIRERKWLETEEEGVSNTSWVQEGGHVVASWRCVEVMGELRDNGSLLQISSPTNLNGTKITTISEEEFKELNLKDPIEAPPSPYIVQPSNLGKFVFISGPPGAGKSSIAAWLSLNADYVYYEGDGFMFGLNPYTPAGSDEPSLAARVQHPLVGEGMHERKAVIDNFSANFGIAIGDYSNVDRDVVDAFIKGMADDITKERRRLGGDWIVAFAVPDLMSRDLLRQLLGEDLVFVVLQLSPELQKERLADRSADEGEINDLLASIYEIYEPAKGDEERVIGFDQKAESSIEQNSQEVLQLINQYYSSD